MPVFEVPYTTKRTFCKYNNTLCEYKNSFPHSTTATRTRGTVSGSWPRSVWRPADSDRRRGVRGRRTRRSRSSSGRPRRSSRPPWRGPRTRARTVSREGRGKAPYSGVEFKDISVFSGKYHFFNTRYKRCLKKKKLQSTME